tara:strand:+ start:170 stop:310 length:141 start_codon:yes stop_codon:yes gene_type:complete
MWFDRGLDFGYGSSVDGQLGNLLRYLTLRKWIENNLEEHFEMTTFG